MKITFSNLGTIKKTTLDLRPLTVIIGPNNTNKTYLAYSIYGLHQILMNNAGQFIYDIPLESQSRNHISLKIDGSFFDQYINECENIVSEFTKDLEVFFQDSSHRLFSKTNFKIHISKNDIKRAFKRKMERGFDHRFEFRNDVLTFYFDDASILSDKNRRLDAVLNALIDLEVGLSFRLFSTPFVLPAERNALILSYKIMENRRLSALKNRGRRTNKRTAENVQLPLFSDLNVVQFPQPIEDFLGFLNNLDVEIKPRKTDYYSRLASLIEDELQQKNKTTLSLSSGEIKITIRKGLEIDLYNASSSTKQLTPLLLYIRYKVSYNDLIIIDEPEMNLHPESQAKLLEILAILTNMGVKVLLTTHSPYFMAHLNNLISANKEHEEIREKQAKSLYLKDSRAFLSSEDVSAYEIRKDRSGNHKLHNLKDKDYGIRWDTLSDVSAEIQQKYFEIYETGKQSSDGEEEEKS